MSTATTTTTTTISAMQAQGLLPLKATSVSSTPAPSTAEATLQSLYNRATRAFLHRDLGLASSLVASAFAILQPPIAPAPDVFDSHRRKWDILRITLEAVVYSSPPDRSTLPETLRQLLLSSPQSFVTTSHARSLGLFTPSSLPRAPTPAFLPHQVLLTLVTSSIKVNCPIVGREITEDWLSHRGHYDFIPSTGEAYEKVLELYCLHVLPRLEEWDYAKEFLSYEVELSPEKRMSFLTSLEGLQAHAMKERESQKTSNQVLVPVPPRSPSPAPSVSSSSSSLSTTSTRTAVPLTRTELGPSRLRKQRTGSTSSVASDATVTKRTVCGNSKNPTRASSNTSAVRAPRVPQNSVVTTRGQSSPDTLTLIKESIRTYFTSNRLTTLAVLFILLPVLSLVIRLRRARAATIPASTADQVKRRLFDARGDSVLRTLWNEVVRAVWDTIRMGGGGLV